MSLGRGSRSSPATAEAETSPDGRRSGPDVDSTDSGGILGENTATPPTASSLEAGGTTSKDDDDDDHGGSGGDSGGDSGSTMNTDTDNKTQPRAGSENGSSNNDTNNSAVLRAGREKKNGRSKLPVVPARTPAAAQVRATAAVRPEVPTIVTRSGGNRRSSSTTVSSENMPVLLPPPSGSEKGNDGEQELTALPPKPRMSQVTDEVYKVHYF